MKFLKNIYEYIKENENSPKEIKDILIKRIPFLKQYKIFNHPRNEKRLEAQRVIFNKDVKFFTKDGEMINFPQYNVSSEITYYPHTIYDNTFHNFIIKNQFHAMPPKDWDELKIRVFSYMKKEMEQNLSYNKEIMVKNDEEIPQEELNKIINEMNKCLFEFEEFTNKHSINLF